MAPLQGLSTGFVGARFIAPVAARYQVLEDRPHVL
jgi:hypothetical protein